MLRQCCNFTFPHRFGRPSRCTPLQCFGADDMLAVFVGCRGLFSGSRKPHMLTLCWPKVADWPSACFSSLDVEHADAPERAHRATSTLIMPMAIMQPSTNSLHDKTNTPHALELTRNSFQLAQPFFATETNLQARTSQSSLRSCFPPVASIFEFG